MAIAVIISVLMMVILSLLRVNVMISIIIATLIAGLINGKSISATLELMIQGMAGGGNTALSYVLLGAFAVAITYSGITKMLVKSLLNIIKGKRSIILLVIAGAASLSQNVIPVHIAFIPILIPPLLSLFDKMKIDRRGVAAALTFGLKAPYVMIPVGFGFIFQGLIMDNMIDNGMTIGLYDVTLAMLIPGLGMVFGLFVAIFFTYRNDRIYETTNAETVEEYKDEVTFERKHWLTIVAILAALAVQILTESLILTALTGLALMFLFLVVPFKEGEEVVTEGVKMMGMIAFIMLVANGFANVLQATGSVSALVEQSGSMLGDNKAIVSLVLLLVGLIITMGIGTSFGTVPILAVLYVPIASAAGFSPLATAALIGTAGALGDAGSPASDSTLGPTSGLNADGKHHHIWDTCVPTFIHFNIPLFIFGWAATLIL